MAKVFHGLVFYMFFMAKNKYGCKLYETFGFCRLSDYVVYNSRATQTSRNLLAGDRQIEPPRPMHRHDTSPGSPRRAERSRRHRQSQLSGRGKLWRAPDRDFWRPLQLAIAFSTAIADDLATFSTLDQWTEVIF